MRQSVRFFLCADTRTNFHWSVAFRGLSLLPRGLHPSNSRFFSFYPSRFSPQSSLRFPFSSPSSLLSLSLSLSSISTKGMEAERKGHGSPALCMYEGVRVSKLGHGSLHQHDCTFRVSPRVPGKACTCHPSAETGRRRRSNAVSPLSLLYRRALCALRTPPAAMQVSSFRAASFP